MGRRAVSVILTCVVLLAGFTLVHAQTNPDEQEDVCDQEISFGTDCFCDTDTTCSGCALDVPYGAACWLDFSSQQERAQTMDIYLPKGPTSISTPVILFTHGFGRDKSLSSDRNVTTDLLVPALQSGYIVVSVEYRHPLLDLHSMALIDDIPTTDVTQSVQFLRCVGGLTFDKELVFLVARSRGTIGVWTAVQDDYITASVTDGESRLIQESSSFQGVWAVDASTSWWPQFILFSSQWYQPDAAAAASLKYYTLGMLSQNKGHALQDVTNDDPPLHLVYTEPLPANDAKYTVADVDNMLGNPHYNPKQGQALCQAYEEAFGDAQHCTAAYNVTIAHAFEGALDFFNKIVHAFHRPHIPKERISQVHIDFELNQCSNFLWTTGRIVFVVVASVSLTLILLILCCMLCRRQRRVRDSGGDWCSCCEPAPKKKVKRKKTQRSCAERNCTKTSLPGMKWCIEHGGVVVYERVYLS